MASQLTGVSIAWSTVGSGTDQRKYQSSATLAFVRGFTGDRCIPAQKASNAENVSIWWRHHVYLSAQNISLSFERVAKYAIFHYSDITWETWVLKSPAAGVFIQQLVQANNKRKHQSSAWLARSDGTCGFPIKGSVTLTLSGYTLLYFVDTHIPRPFCWCNSTR